MRMWRENRQHTAVQAVEASAQNMQRQPGQCDSVGDSRQEIPGFQGHTNDKFESILTGRSMVYRCIPSARRKLCRAPGTSAAVPQPVPHQFPYTARQQILGTRRGPGDRCAHAIDKQARMTQINGWVVSAHNAQTGVLALLRRRSGRYMPPYELAVTERLSPSLVLAARASGGSRVHRTGKR